MVGSMHMNDVHSGDGRSLSRFFFSHHPILTTSKDLQSKLWLCVHKRTHTHTFPLILIHKQKVDFARLALSTSPHLSVLSLSVCLDLSLFYLTFSFFFILHKDTSKRSFYVFSLFVCRVRLLALVLCFICLCWPLCFCAWLTVNDLA